MEVKGQLQAQVGDKVQGSVNSGVMAAGTAEQGQEGEGEKGGGFGDGVGL